MSPYALDEAHRQRCLAALGIDGSVLRADLYAVRSRTQQALPPEGASKAVPTSIAAVRQIVVEDDSAPKVHVPEDKVKRPAQRAEVAPAVASVPQPALDNFSVAACHNGLHWFGVFSGEQKSPAYKAQRALFQSICSQFGNQFPSGEAASDHGALVTVFQWPPLKPSVLGLLGGVDQLAMYRRCIAERLPALVAAQELSADARRQPVLLFDADLEAPESGSVAGAEKDQQCLPWREILTMSEDSLRNVSRLVEQLGPRIVLLPPLNQLLADFELRRRVQTVLLLLSSRRLSAPRD